MTLSLVRYYECVSGSGCLCACVFLSVRVCVSCVCADVWLNVWVDVCILVSMHKCVHVCMGVVGTCDFVCECCSTAIITFISHM